MTLEEVRGQPGALRPLPPRRHCPRALSARRTGGRHDTPPSGERLRRPYDQLQCDLSRGGRHRPTGGRAPRGKHRQARPKGLLGRLQRLLQGPRWLPLRGRLQSLLAARQRGQAPPLAATRRVLSPSATHPKSSPTHSLGALIQVHPAEDTQRLSKRSPVSQPSDLPTPAP